VLTAESSGEEMGGAALNEQFSRAADRMTKLPKKPNEADLTIAYGLYKQGASASAIGKEKKISYAVLY
jgi:acyl-CoA-binding protein